MTNIQASLQFLLGAIHWFGGNRFPHIAKLAIQYLTNASVERSSCSGVGLIFQKHDARVRKHGSLWARPLS